MGDRTLERVVEMPPKATAYEDIFGGGDDSDLSDVEEERAVQQPKAGAGGEGDGEGAGETSEAEGQGAADDDDDDDDEPPEPAEPEEDDEEDADDRDYTQTTIERDADGLPKFKKDPTKKRSTTEGEERPKKRPKKKQREAEDRDGDVESAPYDPIADRNARLDAILAPKKKKAPRKRKAGEDIDLDELADEEVYRLRQLMASAVDHDKEAHDDGRPAIEKLKLLPEVVAILQKPHLEQTILEADVLTQMRRWLEPVGKSMPALNIQRALLEALTKLDIETSQLKAADLGKVVLFYSKHPKLDPSIKRVADQLVMAWMRPIVRRSAQARDRAIARAEAAAPARRARPSQPAAGSQKPAESQIGKRHAAIPQPINAAYQIAPISNVSQIQVQKSNLRFKSIRSRLEASKAEHKKL